MQNGDLHLSDFWNDDKTWTWFNIDKETRVYDIQVQWRWQNGATFIVSSVFWSILKSHSDRKNKSTYQDYLCGSKKKKFWLILMICILKTETNVWSFGERKGKLGMSLTVPQEIGMFSPIFTCTLSKLKLWIHGIHDCFKNEMFVSWYIFIAGKLRESCK